MRIVLIGCVKSSEYFLNLLINHGYAPVGVVTKSQSQFNSDFVDLAPLCETSKIPYVQVIDVNEAYSISKMKDVFDEIRPELVFLPSPQDAHSDHRIVYECALACTKAFRAPYVRKILCMDIISETNFSVEPFNANCYINISQFIEKKLNIMAHYQSEFLEPPFPRSKEGVLAQARYKGSACYCEYAESFQIVKEIIT